MIFEQHVIMYLKNRVNIIKTTTKIFIDLILSANVNNTQAKSMVQSKLKHGLT